MDPRPGPKSPVPTRVPGDCEYRWGSHRLLRRLAVGLSAYARRKCRKLLRVDGAEFVLLGLYADSVDFVDEFFLTEARGLLGYLVARHGKLRGFTRVLNPSVKWVPTRSSAETCGNPVQSTLPVSRKAPGSAARGPGTRIVVGGQEGGLPGTGLTVG